MYSIYLMKIELTVSCHFIVLISGLPDCKRKRLIQKTERSDSIILGILGIFVFSYFFG